MHEPSATSAEAPVHGGDLAAASKRYGEPADGWLDLSTGINPEPYPYREPPIQVAQRLPDSGDMAALIDAAKSYYGTEAHLTSAGGSQAFIQSLPRLRAPGRVAVISPTYSEHAIAWSRAGHQVEAKGLEDKLDGYDVVVIVNPNNPDGRIVSPEAIMSMAEGLASRGGLMVVDEAFADVDASVSVADQAGGEGLVVLRSFGKFFGLAGLRLGFALSDAATAGELERQIGPWAVSGPAIHIGCQAFGDAHWQTATRARLAAARDRIDALLKSSGHRVAGGTALFRLLETEGPGVHRHLASHGIWTRIFAHDPHILRLGLPGAETDWQRLENALMG